MSNTLSYRPRATNPLYHFGWGMRFYFSGLRMLVRNPALLALSLIPIALTVVLLLGLALGCAWLIGQLFTGLLGDQMRFGAQFLVFLLALLLGYFLYLPLARVLLAPLSELLSRKTHLLSTGTEFQAGFGWMRAIVEGVKLALLHLATALAALALSVLFPPIGAPLGILTAIFLCGLDFLDVPLSARGIPLRKKLGVIGRNKSLALGFGAAGYLMLLIPGVNLLSLPVGVVGATLLTDQLELPRE